MTIYTKCWRIVYRTKDGGYRAGTRRYMKFGDALKAFAKNRDSKNPTVKHIAEYAVPMAIARAAGK